MEEIEEIATNKTIPRIPPLPGVAPLIHALRASDGQILPLGSAGTAVAQELTPQKFGFFADGWLWVAQSLGLFGWLVSQSVGCLVGRSVRFSVGCRFFGGEDVWWSLRVA